MRDLETVADIIKEILTATPEKMYITLETTYTPCLCILEQMLMRVVNLKKLIRELTKTSG
ncbi:hypothetical protein E3E31_01750 [Thermococcus sp. M39]|uniref:hypothetical protein n=1 Tax=unclassified Thermococcus TaxID=2627626 RepID=UPI00143B53FB|nr:MULTISPECIES: hypothetical protein [unclassified Thermococcus]NJE07279.1 hypothetical protein [Thermococcus sp. M39]NJE12589.1 hypothetical protein [Thermococcus sp. LS2]